jgi:signal transduction histidine kinase
MIGSFILMSREKALFRKDIENQGKTLAEISRLMLTNVMVYNELGMMNNQDLVDFLDFFIMNLMEQDKRVQYVEVLDEKGWVLAHSDISEYGKNYAEDKSIKDAITDLKTEIAYKDTLKRPALIITTPLNIDTKNWGVLRLGLSTEEVRESIRMVQKEVVQLNLLFSVISLIIVSSGAKVLSKPVLKLSKTMDNIKTHGDLDYQNLEIKNRRDEIGKLQMSFLWMLQRLKEADKEHKETKKVLDQTEKMVAIGRLASGVAHEINNPLSGIMLCFDNLLKTNADDEKRTRLIKAVREGLQKIKHIVEQLLNYSSMTVTKKQFVDLNEQLNSMHMLIEHSASKQNIKIINDFDNNIPQLNIDINKISQVFLNIILNAIQSMNGKGKLTIKTRKEDAFCMVYIEDTGSGISPEIMPYIFDPFFTTKGTGEGTGLGLSVSKSIVEKHGGSIDVKSQVGVGTTFRISLPVSR